MKAFVTLIVLLVAKFGDFIQHNNDPLMKYAKRCDDLAKQPYFDIYQVVSQTWRVYYTWFMNLETKCLDLNFRNATPASVSRLYRDMVDYLEVQPNWDAATLFLTVGPDKHEMLLFADQGSAGSFTGVPNVVRDSGYSGLKPIPLIRYFLKILNGGDYLVMVDCDYGFSTLSTKSGTPYRSEVLTTVRNLPIPDDGHMACTKEKRKGEMTEFV